jgi:heptosyltransferase-2
LKVLVIRFSSIGDIVLTFPVLRCVKEQIPNCELHFASKNEFSELLSASGFIDQYHFLGSSLKDLTSKLKEEKFDLVIDLHNNLRSRLLCLSLGVKDTFHFRKLNFLKWLLVRFKINRLPQIHVVDRYFETIRKLGVSNDGKNNQFFLEKEIDVLKAFGLQNGSFIAIAIGAQYETKQIPLVKIQEIISKVELPIVVLGGKMDIKKGMKLIQLLPNKKIVNACGQFSILESASIIKKSKLLLTGDTGLMHIASCFDIPIFAIWGNTTPHFGMSAYKLENPTLINNFEVENLSCRPCSKIGFQKCPKGHFNCMMNHNSEQISNLINSKFN